MGREFSSLRSIKAAQRSVDKAADTWISVARWQQGLCLLKSLGSLQTTLVGKITDVVQ